MKKKCNNAFKTDSCFPIGSYCSEVPCVACPLAIPDIVKTKDAAPKQLQK